MQSSRRPDGRVAPGTTLRRRGHCSASCSRCCWRGLTAASATSSSGILERAPSLRISGRSSAMRTSARRNGADRTLPPRKGQGPQGARLLDLHRNRDTTSRLRVQLERAGFKVAVLRASVERRGARTGWPTGRTWHRLADHESGTRPKRVGSARFSDHRLHAVGLQLLHLQQASRRSWRIGPAQRRGRALLRIRGFGANGLLASWPRRLPWRNPRRVTCGDGPRRPQPDRRQHRGGAGKRLAALTKPGRGGALVLDSPSSCIRLVSRNDCGERVWRFAISATRNAWLQGKEPVLVGSCHRREDPAPALHHSLN